MAARWAKLEYENFNAASCAIKVHGVNIHPGSAKNQMRNALLMAIEWNSMLPPAETPAHTCGYEGFYHLMHMEGDEELATLQYIIRDHDAQKFDARKATVQQITDYLKSEVGRGDVRVRHPRQLSQHARNHGAAHGRGGEGESGI